MVRWNGDDGFAPHNMVTLKLGEVVSFLWQHRGALMVLLTTAALVFSGGANAKWTGD